MDGSSHSVGIDENGFHVTGHNYECVPLDFFKKEVYDA